LKRFFLWTLATFTLTVVSSFTALGKLFVLILYLPIGIGGTEGMQIFWFIAAMVGVPCFGYAALLFFPSKEGRLAGLSSLTGQWVGLLGGAAAAMKFHQGWQ
jgi:hypothetical protein